MTDQDKASTAPSAETKAAEEQEARASHDADRPPNDKEAKAAPDRDQLDPQTAGHAEEMTKLGAEVKGEGELP